MKDLPEYDLHTRGMRVDDATSEWERLVARARNGNARVFAYKQGLSFSGESAAECGIIICKG